MRRSSTYVIREVSIKTAVRYHYTHLLEEPKSQTLATIRVAVYLSKPIEHTAANPNRHRILITVFVQTRRACDAQSEPQCKLRTVVPS